MNNHSSSFAPGEGNGLRHGNLSDRRSLPLSTTDASLLFERPNSAPPLPPPGFEDDDDDDDQIAAIDRSHHSFPWEGVARASSEFSERPPPPQQNTNFSNLAVAVLGSGLLESMDAGGEAVAEESGSDLLSYHRMKRHLASRLIGQPTVAAAVSSTPHFRTEPEPPSSSHETVLSAPSKPYEAGSRIFSSFDTTTTSSSSHPHYPVADDVFKPRSTTPVQLYPGQHLGPPQRRKDIGMHVVEPEDGAIFQSRTIAGVISQRIDPAATRPADHSDRSSIKELERGMQNLWSPEAREFQKLPNGGGPPSGNSSISDPVTASEFSSRQADLDIQPFCWDTGAGKYVSRTLIVLHVSWLRVPDVRTACETFGVLESFRADFASRGIFFVSYYDIRSAQYASVELQSILQRLSVMQRSSDEVVVKFCLSLSSSSQFDDSHLVIYNLSPHEMKEATLMPLLSSYGAVRMISFQESGGCLVEFQNSQDTKQALLELDSTQPWGPHVIVEVKARDEMERRRGRDLLAILGRWRQALNRSPSYSGGAESQYGTPHARSGYGPPPSTSADPWYHNSDPSRMPPQQHPPESVQPQYILGPDGRYTQVYVPTRNPNGGGYSHPNPPPPPPHLEYAFGEARSGYGGYPPPPTRYTDRRYASVGHVTTPFYAHTVAPPGDANSLGRSLRSGHTDPSHHGHSSMGGGGDKGHLLMDLDLVELGQDTRTSLMVRNIPNKYTQQMLLSEFEANGHGPGIIDFFYLPIDFKNRCNRGYAFINFVSYKDILSFHRRYFGKHWRTFNSDKICDITYARIQGKDAMLKRFENSALMEKDDEYKPLVFASDGPNRGTRLPFPDPNLQFNSSSNGNHAHHMPMMQHATGRAEV